MKRYWTPLFVVTFAVLVALRVPSLVQPAGNDQGLYAYVGQQIARGGVPYRDAWDQKPPAIHLIYAAMYAVWPADAVVPATDLVVTIGAALLLVALGRRLHAGSRAGELAALLFLLLANPAFQRLGGMYVRAQCETFIGLLALAALLLTLLSTSERERGHRLPRRGMLVASGLALGAMFLLKYNAGTYAAAAVATVVLTLPRERGPGGARPFLGGLMALCAGFAVPIAAIAAWIALEGALPDLIAATITYNLGYSGETYGGAVGFLSYLVTFPVRHAATDSLWFLGGAACALLLVFAARDDRRWMIVPVWVAAACLSIAVNGGRGLPQYFVQAMPLLALAAGLGLASAWRSLGVALRAVLIVGLAVAVTRVSPFDKLADNTWRDLQYARGGISRNAYLSQFTSSRTSAAALREMADLLQARTKPADHVLVFGFSGNAYVRARRTSASRFFWSRPVLVGFNEGTPGYGAASLLHDLRTSNPAIVVLQMHDWPAEGIDSATYFLQHRALGPWLRSAYDLASQNDCYMIWQRRSGV